MAKSGSFNDEDFNNLLAWLDNDRERAGETYVEIQNNIIRMLAWRGCTMAEEIAYETMIRVARKVSIIAKTYVGNPRLYFYGVAWKIYKEYIKKQPEPLLPPQPGPNEEKERRLKCLDSCMDELGAEDKDLTLSYFKDEKRAKIDHRKELAARLGVSISTLRMRVHRIKALLQKCVDVCLKENPSQ